MNKREGFLIAAYMPAGFSIHRAGSTITYTFYLPDIGTESLTRQSTPIHDVAVIVSLQPAYHQSAYMILQQISSPGVFALFQNAY
jgi:hypothetical protein